MIRIKLEILSKTVSNLIKKISNISPHLKFKLKLAGILTKPEDFVKKILLSAFYITTGVSIFIFLAFTRFNKLRIILLLITPLIYFFTFLYTLKLPDIKILKKEKEIDKEIIFAIRFIIIELESGISLYKVMINIQKNYEVVGKYFKEITDKVELGKSMEDVLNEAAEFVPSNNLRKVLWQITSSLNTGSNIARSLYSVADQITKEQINEVNKYGKKLNPLAMFYLISAVILPSLGMTMLIILSSFIKFELNITVLLIFSGFLGFIQIMFIKIIKSSRPAIDF